MAQPNFGHVDVKRMGSFRGPSLSSPLKLLLDLRRGGQVKAKFTLADITKGQLTSQACERGRRAEQKDGETQHRCRADEEVWRR